MNSINKTQFSFVWAALIAIGSVAGFLRPDHSIDGLSGQSILNSETSTRVLSKQEIQAKAKSLNQILSGEAIGLDSEAGSNSGDEPISNAVPFSVVQREDKNTPFISAIVLEEGETTVYIRTGREKAERLSVGDNWNGWTIEAVEASKVYFSNQDENFEYLVFANLGTN